MMRQMASASVVPSGRTCLPSGSKPSPMRTIGVCTSHFFGKKLDQQLFADLVDGIDRVAGFLFGNGGEIVDGAALHRPRLPRRGSVRVGVGGPVAILQQFSSWVYWLIPS